MIGMTDVELYQVDPGDIGDVLLKIEKSFDIQFTGDELKDIEDFGELCDHVKSKIHLEKSEDCASQQAFYKLRNAIATVLKLDKKTILPNTLLKDLLPKQTRGKIVEKIEAHLGFELKILNFPSTVTNAFIIVFLASFIGMFFYAPMAIGLILSLVTHLFLPKSMKKELTVKTMGELAKKMVREHYLESRGSPNTFNEQEIDKLLVDLFSQELGLEESKLGRDATYI
ncbi:MAG: hypothetical protein AB8B69_14375 [Chitinophagales bacterium]